MPPLNNPNNNENEPGSNSKSNNYHALFPGLQILLGSHSQAHKIFGITSRNKQSPATSIVSAVYNKVVPAKYWENKDLDEILRQGDKLYRTSINLIPLKPWQMLKLKCVHPTFYVGQHKVTIFVGNDIITGDATRNNTTIAEYFVEVIPELLEKHYAIVVSNQDKYFSLWKNDGSYYFFCPHDGNEEGTLVRFGMGQCFVIRSESIEKFSSHLCSYLCGRFSIFSIRILKFSGVACTMSDLIGQIQNDGFTSNQDESTLRKATTMLTASNLPPSYLKDVRKTAEMFNIRTNANFKSFTDGQGSIIHTAYEKDVDMIIFNNLAAIITLHKRKSASWTSQTIAEIFTLGKELSTVNFDIDTHITSILEVQVHEKSYRLHFEKVVFGKVTSKDDTIPTINNAMEPFFDRFDVGMIDGPQSLAIWKEKGLYFSFDAKERDRLGRKWTHMFSKELGATKKGGGACVLWYDDPKKITDTYISNVSVKHRNDSFRLIHIKVEELPKGDNWNDWLYINRGRWMIEGTESICKYLTPNDVDKMGKLLTTACFAVAFIAYQPEDKWTSETLNTILEKSFEYYKNLQLQKLEEFQTTNNSGEVKFNADENVLHADDSKIIRIVKLSDLGKVLSVEEKKFFLIIEECVVSGNCTANSKGESGLKAGLNEFFENYRSGIITIEDSVLLVWSDGSVYYILDFMERMNLGRTVTKSSNHLGNVTAVRFEILSDLLDAIASNPKYLGCGRYCISKVEANNEQNGELPLRYYEPFGRKAGILFQQDFHEGHPIFEQRANKQTICNLLTSLCFASIIDSIGWSRVDLVDILRTGDKIYTKISENFGECEINHRKITWDEIQPEIGMSSFTYNTDKFEGILAKPLESSRPELPIADNSEENKHDINPSLVENPSKLDYIPQKFNQLEGEQEELEPVNEPDTLETFLKTQNSTSSFNGILECDFFSIAIWKQNSLYFVFDSKANNKQGFPSPQRIQQGVQNAQNRAAEKEKEKLIMLSAIADPEEEKESEVLDHTYSLNEMTSKTDDPTQRILREVGQISNEEPTRNSSQPVDIAGLSNDGSSYVACFQTLDDVLAHVISKVPEKYRNIPITFHTVHIERKFSALKRSYLNNYEQRDQNGFWILRASTSQNDYIFPNRNYLAGSSSIVALAFTMITPADEWSTTMLDIVLKYGDRLHSKTIFQEPTHDRKSKLKIEQLAKSFSIYKFKFDYNIKECENLFTVNNPENFEEINPLLIESINKIDGNQNIVGLVMNLNSHYQIAVWKNSSHIFIFDSFGNDPDGKYYDDGVSCVMRFTNFDVLFKVLRQKFNNIREAITCQICEVEMETSMPPIGPVPQMTLINFHVPSAQSAFVYNEGDDLKMLQADHSGDRISEIFMDLAAIVLSHLLHAACWTPTVMNKVFSLAQHLQDNSTEIKINNKADILEMDLKGLVRCFTVDETTCTVNINERIRGPIIAKVPTDVSLQNGLFLLLRNYYRAIVITTSFICAVWREDDTYYLFNRPDRHDKPIVISSSRQDELYDWMIKNQAQKYICNWYEIVCVEIGSIRKKELKTCRVKKYFKKQFQVRTATQSTCPHLTKATTCGQSKRTMVAKPEQMHKSMDLYKRGKAACIVAAGMSHLKNIFNWKKDAFDIISRSALLLYMDSVAVQGRTSIEMVNMEKIFLLQQIQLRVEALAPTEEEPTQQNIIRILTEIYQKYRIAYVSTPSDNVLVIRWKNKFYTFHPEKISIQGCHCKAHTKQFQTFEELVKYLTENIGRFPGKAFFGAIKVLLL